jgi:hypothetical protein
MALFTLVEPGLAPAAQRRVLEPVQHKQSTLDLANFLKGDINLVLPLVGRELSQHQ